jgi:hypothetical protein
MDGKPKHESSDAEFVHRRKKEGWYARPRHSTSEGRARASAILEQNAVAPPDPAIRSSNKPTTEILHVVQNDGWRVLADEVDCGRRYRHDDTTVVNGTPAQFVGGPGR